MIKVNPHIDKLPFGIHNDKPIVRVPLSYLRWLSSQNTPWAKVAQEELDRRGYIDNEVHFAEHAIERFSTRILKLQKGIITNMKELFEVALKEGTWKENKLIHGKFRWTVHKWKDAKGRDQYDILSVREQ